MEKNFDFKSLNLEIIDPHTNYTPDIYFNQNGLTFSTKAVEMLDYPRMVICQLDAKKRVFTVSASKEDEAKAFKFSKPKEEQQKSTVSITLKNLLEPLRKCTSDLWEKGVRYKVAGFWVDEYKTLCFDLNEGEPVPYRISASSDENETKE